MLTGLIILIVLGGQGFTLNWPTSRSLPPSPSSSGTDWASFSASLSLSASSSPSFSPSPSPSWAKPGSWAAVTFVPHADWRPARSSQPTVSSSPLEQPAPPGLMVLGPDGRPRRSRSRPLLTRGASKRVAARLRTPEPRPGNH